MKHPGSTRTRPQPQRAGAVGLMGAAIAIVACSSSGAANRSDASSSSDASSIDGGAPDGPGTVAFEPVSPYTYVAKVKNILVGLPPTDAEVQKVVADPTQLDGARSTAGCSCPSTAQKMKRFFELAFQQTQITAVDFADQAYPKQIGINATTTPLLRAERAAELRAHDAAS